MHVAASMPSMRRTCVAAVIVTLAVRPAAFAAEPAVSGSDPNSLDQYYTESANRYGSFPGRLVCVSTEHTQVPENAESCGDHQVYALAIDVPHIVVPIIASSKTASAHFPSLLNQPVIVRGKHYPDKGLIAVASVESSHTAVDAPAPPDARAPADR